MTVLEKAKLLNEKLAFEGETKNTFRLANDVSKHFTTVGIDGVVFEITRWCNMLCEHCLRGEREKKKMQKKYIDAFLDSVSWIGLLTFTGGEPTLAVELIEYTLLQCKIRSIPVHNVWVTTNGLIKSRKLLKIMTEFIEYTKEFDGEFSGISLSTDQFHDILPEENYWFYRDYRYYESSKDCHKLEETIPEGRAYWNGLSTNNHRILSDESFSVELCEDELIIKSNNVYLNVNGDILLNCDYSYETQEYNSRFNIFDSCGLIGGLLLQDGVLEDLIEDLETKELELEVCV